MGLKGANFVCPNCGQNIECLITHRLLNIEREDIGVQMFCELCDTEWDESWASGRGHVVCYRERV